MEFCGCCTRRLLERVLEGGFGSEPYRSSLCSTGRTALDPDYFEGARYWRVFAAAFGADRFDTDESAVAFGAAAAAEPLDSVAADTSDTDALDTFVAAAVEIDAFAAAFGIGTAAAGLAVDAAAAECAAFAAAHPGQRLLGAPGRPNSQSLQ